MIAELYTEREEALSGALKRLADVYAILRERPEDRPVVYEIIRQN